jgi:putative sigma-54 modulation protein
MVYITVNLLTICNFSRILLRFFFGCIQVKDAHRVEVVMNVKGTTIICKNTSPDMYESIDAAASALSRKLGKYKERRIAGYHGGANMGEDLRIALESIDSMENTDNDNIAATKMATTDDAEYDDPFKKEVVKINSFQLDKPISIDEAIFALDYVDHDFYVFTNEGTGKINVVYKRHTGGVGLVEP